MELFNKVEMAVLYENNTWKSHFILVSCDYDEDELIEEAESILYENLAVEGLDYLLFVDVSYNVSDYFDKDGNLVT